ncbi:MAG: HAMP domain-containing sensor histidine kinase [Acidimicrobiia bacterium]
MSLRWKIAVGLAAIAALVSAFCATGAYLTTSRQLRNGIDDSLTSRSAGVRDGGRGGPVPRPGPDSIECPPPGLLEPASAAQLVDGDGTTVTQCLAGAVALPVDARDRVLARQGGADRLRTVTVGGREYRMLTAALPEHGALQTARGLDEMQSVLSSLALRLLVIGVVGTMAAALLGWFLARRIVRPIDELRDTAEKIAHTQDLDVPIPTTGGGEVGSLATSFSTMVDRLGTSRRQQRQLITDAGHELRTPLTSLRTHAELLERDLLDAQQRRSAARGIQVEVEELTSLVGELVELATDQSANVEEPAPIVLADVAHEVCELARRRSGRTIRVDASADEPVIARPQMMHRAITNLVDNALKYGPRGTPIDVVVGRARVEVLDRGPGIAAEDQPHVFERFYRAAAARTEPGSGLGLAIVAQIVERHGGTVWARNRDDGPGASVGFDLTG